MNSVLFCSEYGSVIRKNIPFLFVSFLVLSGGNCEANTEINEVSSWSWCPKLN